MKKPVVGKHDVHIVINDWETSRYVGEAKCYSPNEGLLWTIPALCKGVEGARWDIRNGDTPPGLYRAGTVTETQQNEDYWVWAAFGRWFVDLLECEDQEVSVGRSGIGWHGGGSAAPDPLASRQQLLPTLGCVRSHNSDIQLVVIPTIYRVTNDGGIVWITVNQIEN